MRSLGFVALLGLIGCGVGPTDETGAALATGGTGSADSICAAVIPTTLGITSSATNPWGSRIGVITVYTTTDGKYVAYGTDYPYTQVYWYMSGATTTDIAALEAYPQSMRWCQGNQGSVGGGAAPKGQPDPNIYGGVCVPSTIAADADNAYYYGPYGTGTNSFCYYDHGPGGCIPRRCGTMCGGQSDGCGGYIYCGICHPCQCGGTYPHCNVCSF